MNETGPAITARERDGELTGAPGLPAAAAEPARPDGAAEGYRANRTLPLRIELRRQLLRRRTRLTLGLLAVLPLLLLLTFELGGDADGARPHELIEAATSSGLNFAVFAVFASANFLLVVVVALFFGDTVAGEASWSSLKYLLAAPVPRCRLLRQKAKAAAVLSGLGLLLLPAVALAVGLLRYGGGELISPTGEVLPVSTGLLALAGASTYLALHLAWVAGLALWFGVSTDAPLGAVGGAVLVSILSQILDEIAALGDLRVYLPTHHSTAWADLLSTRVDWADMANGVFSGLAYAAVFLALAARRFATKDITS